jgi:CBS domain containing-hemolysin-like protein
MSASSIPANPVLYNTAGFVLSIPLGLASGALAARVFTSLNPVAGACLMGISVLSAIAGRVTASCFKANLGAAGELFSFAAGQLFSLVGVAAFGDAALKAAGFAAVGPLKAVLFTLGTQLAILAVIVAVVLPIMFVLSDKKGFAPAEFSS